MTEYRSEDIADLSDRLHRATIELKHMAYRESDPSEEARLIAKLSGVNLAIDYLRAYRKI